jgi:hypothetical protein
VWILQEYFRDFNFVVPNAIRQFSDHFSV